MLATHFNPELANTIYQDVFFSIDAGQFPECADLIYEVETRIHDHQEAIREAQELANRFNMPVSVSVYGTWGFYGREYVDCFTVQPERAAA